MREWIRPLMVATCTAAMLGSTAAAASASEKVDTNSKNERIMVSKRGVALVLYKAHGQSSHVLYWGAKNADRRKKSTLEFKHDRSGGWKSHMGDWEHFRNTCKKYTGPELPYVVASCTARDGSHWVLQKWARLAPNYGGKPERYRKKELRLSHFDVAPAVFKITPNWSWGGQYMHIVATLKYRGKPWYAVKFSTTGQVKDKIGRNVTIDSYNSDMGSGWRRVNAILTHRPSGQMCFGFTPKNTGNGTSASGYSGNNTYRLTVPGPGVSPDVQQEFSGVYLQDYTKEADEVVNDYIRGLLGSWGGNHNCKNVN